MSNFLKSGKSLRALLFGRATQFLRVVKYTGVIEMCSCSAVEFWNSCIFISDVSQVERENQFIGRRAQDWTCELGKLSRSMV